MVLAAGKGRRLAPVSSALPKPLLPILDRPLVLWQLEALQRAGLVEVVLVVGHLGDRIASTLGDGRALGLELRYVEQREPHGIAHALLAAGPLLTRPFVCLLGDVFFEAQDLARLVREFLERGPDGVLAVREEADPDELARNFSVALDGEGWVRTVVEKPPPERGRLRGAGLYLFRPELLSAARATPRSALRGEHELTDAVQLFIEGGARVAAVRLAGRDINLSEPAHLLQANLRALALSGRPCFVAADARVDPGGSIQQSVVLSRARVAAGAHLLRSLVLPGETVGPGRYEDALFAAGRVLSCAPRSGAGRW